MSTRKKREKLNPKGKLVRTKAEKQTRFLNEFGKHANVSLAAAAAGVNRHQHYLWMQEDDYAERFAEAHKHACDAIDGEIYRRGVTGIDEPVWYQGKECGAVRKYDTTLLIFFGKGLMPEKYRDNYKADINISANLQASHKIDLTKLSDEQLSDLDRLLTFAAGDTPGSGNGRIGAAEAEQDTEVLPG